MVLIPLKAVHIAAIHKPIPISNKGIKVEDSRLPKTTYSSVGPANIKMSAIPMNFNPFKRSSLSVFILHEINSLTNALMCFK